MPEPELAKQLLMERPYVLVLFMSGFAQPIRHARLLTPFRDRWCLRLVMVAPAYDIDEDDGLLLDSDPELDRRDGRATIVLGEPTSGAESALLDQPEPLDEDALTVVLHSGERARRQGWVRAPRFAVIALLVLGAGVSIRVLRRQGGDSHVRAGTARHRVTEPGSRAAQKIGVVSNPARPRTSPSPRGRRRPQSRRPPGRMRRDRTVWSARTDRRPLRPTRQEPDDGTASAGGVPRVGDASPPQAEARRSVPSRRPPCVPGTLGC